MTYYGNVNPDLMEIVPLNARRVLEIGCGEGAFAAIYRRRNPKAHYIAVEAQNAAAEKALEHVDEMFVGDFDSFDDAKLTAGGKFDAIIMGDVLEHMRDADHVLTRLKDLLADGGHLALSVPNVAHWTAIFHLFHGNWPAQDSGLFDRTHLRFFTQKSLADALSKAGFGLIKSRPRQFLLDQEKANKWVPPLAAVAEAMGLNKQEFIQRCTALQYVVLAQKSEETTPQLIHIRVTSYAPTLADVRTRLPAEYLRSVPELLVSHVNKDLALPSLPAETPKVVIVQRMIPGSEQGWAEYLATAIRAGWLVVSEWDDHPDLIAQATGRDATRMWTTITNAHAVQTSTELLAGVFRERNPEVVTFANAAFSILPSERRAGHPRIFYGAANRENISAPVARALSATIKRHPKITFEVVHDRAFFDALPTTAKTFHPTLPYEQYLEVMGRCDIALAPLEGAGGERYKSDIKYVEAASRGLAIIASPAVYEATVLHEVTGLLAARIEQWGPALERLIISPPLRQRIAQAAWQDVRDNRMFADQAMARRDWYASLWARRFELQENLIARMPLLGQALAKQR